MGNQQTILSESEREYLDAAQSGLLRNVESPWLHAKDSISNAYNTIIKGTYYLWFDEGGSSYSNLASATRTIEQLFATEVKHTPSTLTEELIQKLTGAYHEYIEELRQGNGRAFHILHVSTRICKKYNPQGTITARDVFSIMCGSVKDFIAPAKGNETARFNPNGPSVQTIDNVYLFGLTSDNPISSTAYLRLMLAVNKTKPGHLLHPGKIFRFITETPDEIFSNTIGLGNAQYFSTGINITSKYIPGLTGKKELAPVNKTADWFNNNVLDNVMGSRIFKSQDMNLKSEVERLLHTGAFRRKSSFPIKPGDTK